MTTWKLPSSKVYHGLDNALGIYVHEKHYQVLPTQMVPISALAHGLNGPLWLVKQYHFNGDELHLMNDQWHYEI